MANPKMNQPMPAAELSSGIPWWQYSALWLGLCFNHASLIHAYEVFHAAPSHLHAVGVLIGGNVLIAIILWLNGRVGAKYREPFAHVGIATFGYLGVKIALTIRGIFAFIWMTVQMLVSAYALYYALRIWFPNELQDPASIVGVTALVLCLCINLWMNWWFMSIWYKSPGQVLTISLLGFGLFAIGSFFYLIDQHMSASRFWEILENFAGPATDPVPHHPLAILPGLIMVVSFWVTMTVNISDFTQGAKSQVGQGVGQGLGLLFGMATTIFVGVLIIGSVDVSAKDLAITSGSSQLVVDRIATSHPWQATMLCLAVVAGSVTTNVLADYHSVNAALGTWLKDRDKSSDENNLGQILRTAFVIGFVAISYIVLDAVYREAALKAKDLVMAAVLNVSLGLVALSLTMVVDFHFIKQRRLVVEELHERGKNYANLSVPSLIPVCFFFVLIWFLIPNREASIEIQQEKVAQQLIVIAVGIAVFFVWEKTRSSNMNQRLLASATSGCATFLANKQSEEMKKVVATLFPYHRSPELEIFISNEPIGAGNIRFVKKSNRYSISTSTVLTRFFNLESRTQIYAGSDHKDFTASERRLLWRFGFILDKLLEAHADILNRAPETKKLFERIDSRLLVGSSIHPEDGYIENFSRQKRANFRANSLSDSIRSCLVPYLGPETELDGQLLLRMYLSSRHGDLRLMSNEPFSRPKLKVQEHEFVRKLLDSRYDIKMSDARVILKQLLDRVDFEVLAAFRLDHGYAFQVEANLMPLRSGQTAFLIPDREANTRELVREYQQRIKRVEASTRAPRDRLDFYWVWVGGTHTFATQDSSLCVLNNKDIAKMLAMANAKEKLIHETCFKVGPDRLSPYIRERGTCFFGREKEREMIRNVIRDGGFFWLIGRSGAGKTSLLRKTETDLEENYQMLFLDLAHLNGQLGIDYSMHRDDLSRHVIEKVLIAEICRNLDRVTLREEFGIELSDVGPVTINQKKPVGSLRRLIFEYERVSPTNRPLALLLDEVDGFLVDYPAISLDILRDLRSIVQDVGGYRTKLSVIASGKAVTLRMIRESGKLYNFGDHYVLRPLKPIPARQLIEVPTTQLGVNIDAELVDGVLKACRCWPKEIQTFCHRYIRDYQGTKAACLDRGKEELGTLRSELLENLAHELNCCEDDQLERLCRQVCASLALDQSIQEIEELVGVQCTSDQMWRALDTLKLIGVIRAETVNNIQSDAELAKWLIIQKGVLVDE